jgi:ribosomal-protein-alanine N-acetyltransferase
MIAGYICFTLLFDEAEILDVAVMPSQRGHGVGARLVAWTLEFCRHKGASFVALEVRRSNGSAIRLYQRLGFVQTGERRRYYENGEDALLMRHTFQEHGDDHAV